VIVLPWPPKELSPNFKRRKHWTVYRGPTKAYRETCYWLTHNAGVCAPGGDEPFPVLITFYPPDRRRRDDDGMIGAFKAGRDGMADALRVNDHRLRPTYVIGEPCKGGKVVVTVETP